MKSLNAFWLLLFIPFVFSCSENKELVKPQDTSNEKGAGTLNISLKSAIDISKANARVAVDINDFKVEIVNVTTNTVVRNWDKASDVPSSVSLQNGTYNVRAFYGTNPAAAFDAPYYFGETGDITLAKEQVKQATVNTERANVKVTVNYSDRVKADFTDYSTVVKASDADKLTFGKTETRSGFFAVAPLQVDITLTFPGGVKTETAVIADPKAKDHYIIDVDYYLLNGKLTPIVITKNEATVDKNISLGNINLKNGLLVHYAFDGDATDISGNGNDGVVNGATFVSDRSGNANAAVSFDGIDDYIESIQSGSNLEPAHSEITISYWIKQDAASAGYVFTRMNSLTEESFNSYARDNGIIGAAASTTGVWGLTPSPLDLGVWTHMAYTLDKSSIKVYKNGEFVAENTDGHDIRSTANGRLMVGADNDNGSYNDFLKANIDEFRIYNRLLSDTEIEALSMEDAISVPSVPSSYDVVLLAPGGQKLAVVKEVKFLTGLGLKEAKELVDTTPSVLKVDLETATAEEWKSRIEAVGGVVELR